MQRRIAQYGVAYASKELGIPLLEVNFVSSELLGKTTITAMFLPDQNRILFNLDWLLEATPEEVLLTAFHETRHAYQKNQIEAMTAGKNIESSEVIWKWKTDFEKYHRASDSRTDDPEYLGQEIETDARQFSSYFFEAVFIGK